MRKWLLLSLLLIAQSVYAQAPDRRISDADGHVLNVNSDGTIPVAVSGGLPLTDCLTLENSETICNDTDGRVDITSAGGSNNEDLLIDLETTANEIRFDSGTGVTAYRFHNTSSETNLHIEADSGSDVAIDLVDGDVAHGVTQLQPTDTYFRISDVSGTQGGATITGISEVNLGLLVQASSGSENPNDGWNIMEFRASKRSGINRVDLDGNENAFAFASGDGSPIYLLIQGEGQVSIGPSANNMTAGRFQVEPEDVETISAGATITANSCGTMKNVTASSSITTDTTDTFTAPAASVEGCVMHVCNTSNANTITLDKNANFMTSGGTNISLGPNDCVSVLSDGVSWFQVAAVVDNS